MIFSYPDEAHCVHFEIITITDDQLNTTWYSRATSTCKRSRTAFRSSRSNKELIVPLLKPSAITGDYAGAEGAAQFRGADNRRARYVFYGEKITRSRSPCSETTRYHRRARASFGGHRTEPPIGEKCALINNRRAGQRESWWPPAESRDPVPLSRGEKKKKGDIMSFPYQPSFRYGTHAVGTAANGEPKVEKETETGRTSERGKTPHASDLHIRSAGSTMWLSFVGGG